MPGDTSGNPGSWWNVPFGGSGWREDELREPKNLMHLGVPFRSQTVKNPVIDKEKARSGLSLPSRHHGLFFRIRDPEKMAEPCPL